MLAFLIQALFDAGAIGFGFENWRPVLYAYFLWATALCVSRVMIHGEQGKKALFVLPAVLFVVSMVVFPAAVRPLDRVFRLESRFAHRTPVQRLG